MIKTCIVEGCENTDADSKFKGELCVSCYRCLETGEPKGCSTFIDKLKLERDHFENLAIEYEYTVLEGC